MKEAVDYINAIPSFTAKHTLAHTRKYYDALGIDFEQERIIHVAGTNGKGSVCNFLNRLFREHGLHTVMFTSPHLVRMTERFVTDDCQVEDAIFLAAFDRVRSLCDKMKSEKLPHPTFFEFLFLMLMCICDEVKPDYLILETGLGGRLDATNIFEKPAACVITRIGLDHCRYLGNTPEEIAFEKAGIIKEGVPVVLFSQDEGTDRVIARIAAEKNAPLHLVTKGNYGIGKLHQKTVDFSYQSHYYNIGLTLQSRALYQIENAATALETFFLVAALRGIRTGEDKIRRAMETAVWPGRMEEVMPGIWMDGAHNEDGMRAFLASVREDGCQGQRILMLAVSSDKDAETMADAITASGLFQTVIVTRYENDRAMAPGELSAYFGNGDLQVRVTNEAKEAFDLMQRIRTEQDFGYIAGSLYLVGEMRRMKAAVTEMQDDQF